MIASQVNNYLLFEKSETELLKHSWKGNLWYRERKNLLKYAFNLSYEEAFYNI